jgi:hypothetical protein
MLEIRERYLLTSLSTAYKIWKDADESRRRKLLRKYCLLLMNRTKVGYQ